MSDLTEPVGPGKSPIPTVPNYLVWAVLETIFCCTPLGIVAVVFAAQVNGRLAAGDYAGAVAASERTRKWCWIIFVAGLVEKVLLFATLATLVWWVYAKQASMPQNGGF